MKAKLLPTCRVFLYLFTRTKFIRIYGRVTEQSPFKNIQKCTHAYGGWSVFTKKRTPAVASSAIKVIAFLGLKMERTIL